VVGASGAISGLMAGAVRVMYGFRLAPPGTYPPLAPITSPPVLFFSSIWLAVNFVVGFFGVGFAEEGVDIAWVAHMGGFLAGLITIGYFDRDRLAPRV
jgi:membrane associated rhomboid family serine protease